MIESNDRPGYLEKEINLEITDLYFILLSLIWWTTIQGLFKNVYFWSYLGLKLVRIYFVLFPFWQLIYHILLQIRLCFIVPQEKLPGPGFPGTLWSRVDLLSTALLSQPSVSRKSDPEVRNQGLSLLCRSHRHRAGEGRHGRCWHYRECWVWERENQKRTVSH